MQIYAKRRVFPFEELMHADKGFAVRQVYPKIAKKKEQESLTERRTSRERTGSCRGAGVPAIQRQRACQGMRRRTGIAG